MTLPQTCSSVIPQDTLAAALRHLNAAGLQASEFQPDESPAEIAVSYFPRRRGETAVQAFMRAAQQTTHWRLWAAADGSARITSDQFGQEWSFADLTEAVDALATVIPKRMRSKSMAKDFRVNRSFTDGGDIKIKVVPITPPYVSAKARRKAAETPEVKPPRPYRHAIQTPLAGYLRVTADVVQTEDGSSGYCFNVWTSGGIKGAQHVDTWFEIEYDEPRPGFVALGSTRTPWALWVARRESAKAFEREAAVEIARATGIKRPGRFV